MKQRLLRRGVALPAVLLSAGATVDGATVPRELVSATVSSAVHAATGAATAAALGRVLIITDGVIISMLMQKIRFAATLAVSGAFVAGMVLIAWAVSGAGDQPPARVGEAAVPTPAPRHAAANDGTPEEVFSRAIAALDQDRIDDFVAAMDPEDVEVLRMTFQRVQPDPGAKTDDEPKAREDRAFVARQLGVYLRRKPLFKLALAKTMGEILGHVDDGKESVYLLYRSTVDDMGGIQDRIKVAHLRKDGQHWAMQLPEARAMFAGTMMVPFRSFAGNPPGVPGQPARETLTIGGGLLGTVRPAGVAAPKLPETTTRFDPVGRLLVGGDAAHVVLRHVAPQGNFLRVLTVRKGDVGWDDAAAGTPDGLARLVRTRLYLDPPAAGTPPPRTDPVPGGAAASGRRSPEAVLLQAIDQLNQGRLEDFAAAMRPQAVRQLRTVVMETIGDATSGESAKLPERNGLAALNARAVLARFPGVKSVAELKALDDRLFVAKYLATAFASLPELTLSLAVTKPEPLGHIAEGAERVHVVYRARTRAGRGDTEPKVASLRKDGPTWALELPDDLATWLETRRRTAHLRPWALFMAGQQAGRAEPLGRLLDGPATVHVVYRQVSTVDHSTLSNTRILTVRKSDPGWPEALAGTPEGLGRLIKTTLHLDPSPEQSTRGTLRLDVASAASDQARDGNPFAAGYFPLVYVDNRPRTRAILPRLEVPVTLKYPGEVPLERVLSDIAKATQGPDGPGIPIYVEPVGLAEAEKAMTSLVTIDVQGVPLKNALARVLAPLGLAYCVLDGLLVVGGRGLIDEGNNAPILGCDQSPGTSAILARLAQPVALKYSGPASLERVIADLVKATTGPTGAGVRIYVDPAGLETIEQSMLAPHLINLEGIPLRTTLRFLLRQIGLSYSVHDGLLIVTAPDDGAWERERAPVIALDALPATRAVLARLGQPIALEYPDETPLEQVIADIAKATKGANGPELPIDVNAAGLETAEATMTSRIRQTGLEGIPLRTTLRLLLGQLGLGYFVENGRLTITDLESVNQTVADREYERPAVAADKSLRTLAVLIKLEQPNALMSYTEDVPLGQVVSDIAKPIRDPSDVGIPVRVDPAGLQAAGRTLTSRVLVPDSSAGMTPLRVTLRRVLSVLGLDYYVSDGQVIVSDEVSVQERSTAVHKNQ